MNRPHWTEETSCSQVPHSAYNTFIKQRPPYVAAPANQIPVCTDKEPITDDHLQEYYEGVWKSKITYKKWSAFISILMPYYAYKCKQQDDFCEKLKHDVLQQDLKEHRLLIFD